MSVYVDFLGGDRKSITLTPAQAACMLRDRAEVYRRIGKCAESADKRKPDLEDLSQGATSTIKSLTLEYLFVLLSKKPEFAAKRPSVAAECAEITAEYTRAAEMVLVEGATCQGIEEKYINNPVSGHLTLVRRDAIAYIRRALGGDLTGKSLTELYDKMVCTDGDGEGETTTNNENTAEVKP